MADSRPVLEQYNELLGILGRFTQHKMNMDGVIQVSCIINKLPPYWKIFKHTLKHLKEELTLVELGSHLRIEESLRMQDSDKPKGNNVACPSVVNMVDHNNSSRYNENKGKLGYKSTALVHGRGYVDLRFSSGKIVSLFNVLHVPNIRKNLVSSSVLNNYGYKQHARLGHVHFKRMQEKSKDGLIPAFDMDTEKCKTCMLNKITKKPFQNVKRETKSFGADPQFSYVYLLHNKDEALDKFKVFKTEVELQQGSLIKRFRTDGENRLSSVSRPSQRFLVNRTKDIGGSVVPEEVTEEVVQQPEPELRKSKSNRTLKDFGPEFQLYLIEGTRDEVSDQHSYCFNVEDDPKTFDEAMKS
ncbi:zinc finger, CCHC-type containing protein [Tanacetum coccineum]